jgi:type II secretory pathway predicted ATPase ExeA
MGKTTLLFEALSRLGESTKSVFLFQSISNPTELVRALLIDLGEKDPPETLVDLETRLNQILVEHSKTGKRLVVVVDEAQNLPDSVLEAVRMLSNFETPSHKLLQIVLCGQLQLADKLAQPHLLQLRQRISIFAYLHPLSEYETAEYIQHRLRVAGYKSDKPLFTSQAAALIAHWSGGTPRNINNLCFHSLSLACASKKSSIDAGIVKEVISDLSVRREGSFERISVVEADPDELRHSKPRRRHLRELVFATAFFLFVSTGVWLWRSGHMETVLANRERAHTTSTPQPATETSAADSAQTPEASPLERTTVAAPKEVPEAPRPAKSTMRVVEVRAGQSLSTICTENYGRCEPPLLNRIIRLNPRISDPNYIHSGEKVLLPVLDSGADNDNPNSDERIAFAVAPKRGTR